jgi:hypothetical protein
VDWEGTDIIVEVDLPSVTIPSFEHELVGTTVFSHSWVDDDTEGYDAWGSVAVADFDGDGRDEYATGGRYAPDGGFYHVYDRTEDGEWHRHELRPDFRPAVGATAADIDDDGRPEIVCGEWGSRLFVVDADPTGASFGTYRIVYDGFEKGQGDVHDGPHDILVADLDADGEPEIVTRRKDGRLLVFRETPSTGLWAPDEVASDLEGDGTATADLSEGPGLDLVTNCGWFENVDGTGTEWIPHPLLDEDLEWDPETRIAVGDVDGDGRPEVVITESEMDANARMAVLSRSEGGPWDAEILFEEQDDRRGLHSLAVADVDGDGDLEIITAEMENGKTDGMRTQPRWWYVKRQEGAWQRSVLFDENLGTHCARVLDVDGDGRLDIVGKVWRANDVNGVDGLNHVDCLRQCE